MQQSRKVFQNGLSTIGSESPAYLERGRTFRPSSLSSYISAEAIQKCAAGCVLSAECILAKRMRPLSVRHQQFIYTSDRSILRKADPQVPVLYVSGVLAKTANLLEQATTDENARTAPGYNVFRSDFSANLSASLRRLPPIGIRFSVT